jgi:uridine kinase
VAALARPATVAVDGPDGAGKTVLAGELVALVPGAVGVSLDDFHHPRAHRHALGRTPETVWARSVDLAAVRRELLDPWRRGAGSPYRRRWHDLATDTLVDEPQERVPADGVLVVDGVFAQRPELTEAWDLVIYVHADDAVRVARMAVRDGGPDDPAHPDQRRYLDAQAIYRERCRPADRADVVVDNTDAEQPNLHHG